MCGCVHACTGRWTVCVCVRIDIMCIYVHACMCERVSLCEHVNQHLHVCVRACVRMHACKHAQVTAPCWVSGICVHACPGDCAPGGIYMHACALRG